MDAAADDRLWKFECQLAKKVVASNVRTDQALRDIKLQTAKELGKPGKFNIWQFRRDTNTPEWKFHGMCVSLDEVRIGRAIDDLLETYRRLTRPEKVGQQWSVLRWYLVATTLSKLRCLANVAQWPLPPPANNTSRDPKALQETGIVESSAAAIHIEAMEGEMDARMLRVCARLVSLGESSSQVSKLNLSPEAHTMARLALMNLRNTASKMDLLLSEAEKRSVVMQGLQVAYGALAASLASLRQRFAQEVGERLETLQEPLMVASSAARKLGVERSNFANSTRKEPTAARSGACADPFKALHQGMLLTNIASLTEVRQKPRRDTTNDKVFALLAGGAAVSSDDKEDTNPQGDDEAAWNTEFTAAQLRQMQQAREAKEPNIHGAQKLLAETLECYAKVANAMSKAYGNEKTLRANPAQVANHSELLKLVHDLRGLWKDSGVVLVPSRATDLLALEQVRCRHKKLVLHVLEKNGLEAATVVLARLALVDEMLQEPGTRLLTGEVSFDILKPYQLLESTVRSLNAATVFERRRRRWLRCPHASLHSVLAGEVWRQLLERFLTVEAAFEPLQPCEDIPLSFREFRIALSLLEVNVSERLAVFLFEAAADTSSSGEATTKGLYDILRRYGATTSGDRGMSSGVASAAAKSLAIANDPHIVRMRMGSKAYARAETPSSTGEDFQGRASNKSANSRRGNSKQTPGRRASLTMSALLIDGTTNDDEIDLLECLPGGAPMVCRRCINGDALMLPYSSVQELNRTCCTASRGSDAPKAAKAERNGFSSEDDNDKEKIFSSPEEQTRFGEDTIVSWSTAVLTQSILLAKDERGIYFKWLAKIVLFGLTGSTAEAAQPKDNPQAEGNGKDSGTNMRIGGRRSTVKKDARTFGRRSSFSMSGPESQGRHSIFNAPGLTTSPVEDEAKTQARLIAEAKAKAEAEFERTEYEEALREISVALPETVLNVIRIDLGLQAVAFTSKAQAQARMTQRSSMTALLYSDFTDVIAKGGPSMAQRAKRAAREAKLFVNLRHLNVPESDLSFLQRELNTVAANAQPHVNGILLVAGAARAAQEIIARRSKKSPRTETDLNDGRKDAYKKVADRTPTTRAQQAQKVIESSSTHAQQCYDRCGYETGAQQVAAAFRFLEHELFQESNPELGACSLDVNMAVMTAEATAAFLKVGDDTRETVILLAPLLLPKGTANRLLDQARREEAEEAATREAAEAAKAASAGDQKTRLQLQPIVRVKSIDTMTSGSSRAASKENVRSSTPQSRNSASTEQRDSHRSHGSRRASNSRESPSRSSRRNSRNPIHSPASRGSMAESSDEGWPSVKMNASHFPIINTTPWLTPACAIESESFRLQGHSSDWPPEVLRLFSSVQEGCQRMRSAVTESSTFRTQKHQRLNAQLLAAKMKAADCVVKSQSAPTLLPRVSRPLSDVGNEKRYKRVAAACRSVPASGWSSKELNENSQKGAMHRTF